MDWKKELLRLKQEASFEIVDEEQKNPEEIDQKLLQDISALRLFREMNQFLFDGQARIETFYNQKKYRIVIALWWEGSIGSPVTPSAKPEKSNNIFIGVADQKVYVNGKEVVPATSDNLQQSLLAQVQRIVQLEKKRGTKE